MANPRSVTRHQNDDDDDASSSSSRKRFKSFDKGDVGPWSDINHDVLLLVMMRLSVFDYFAFGGVCKSWRSFALTNRNTYMVSKPPMKIHKGHEANEDEWCHLQDFEGVKVKTVVPHFAGRKCVGSTCGYLILYGEEIRDFWLVNPITRHQLYFHAIPLYFGNIDETVRCILVFSPSISVWVFVVYQLQRKISYSVAGERGWSHVSFRDPIYDICFFKGKIYTLHINCLCELRLNPKLKRKSELTNLLSQHLLCPRLVSSGENLYVVHGPTDLEKVLQLDIDEDEMRLVLPEKTIKDYVFFISNDTYSAAIKPEWFDTHKSGQQEFCCYYQDMWYFIHDCLIVNLLEE